MIYTVSDCVIDCIEHLYNASETEDVSQALVLASPLFLHEG